MIKKKNVRNENDRNPAIIDKDLGSKTWGQRISASSQQVLLNGQTFRKTLDHAQEGDYTVFLKQSHFRFEPRVAIKIPKMRLKVDMKLLSCLKILGSNVWRTSKNLKNWRKLLRIYDLRLESC